jgi:hypothetical protein
LISLAACSGSENKTVSTPHSVPVHSAAPAPQLTVGQARNIFTTFLPKFKKLASDPSLVSQLTTGPETSAQRFGKGARPVPGKLSGERFLVPHLTGYPRWFIAVGSARSQQAFMFVMVQKAAGAGWREAAELYDLSPPPQIMSDLSFDHLKKSGYVNPVTANDVTLTIEPSALSAGYALYLNDQGKGPQRSNFLPGGYTTDYVKADRQIVAGAPAKGWKITGRQAALKEPTYALYLSNGGAMVIFYTSVTVRWTAMSSSAVIPPGPTTGPLYSPPSQFLSQLGISAARPGLRVSATAVEENLAFIGPAGTYGATIVVNDGKQTSMAKS